MKMLNFFSDIVVAQVLAQVAFRESRWSAPSEQPKQPSEVAEVVEVAELEDGVLMAAQEVGVMEVIFEILYLTIYNNVNIKAFLHFS